MKTKQFHQMRQFIAAIVALSATTSGMTIKEGRCPVITHAGDLADGEDFEPAAALEGPWVSLLEEKEALRDFQCLATVFKSFDAVKLGENAPAEGRRVMHMLHSNALSAATQEEFEKEGEDKDQEKYHVADGQLLYFEQSGFNASQHPLDSLQDGSYKKAPQGGDEFVRNFAIIDFNMDEAVHWMLAASCLEVGEHREVGTGRGISMKELQLKAQMPIREYKKLLKEQRQRWADEKGIDIKSLDVPESAFQENPRVSASEDMSEQELQTEHMRYIFDGVTHARLYKLKI